MSPGRIHICLSPWPQSALPLTAKVLAVTLGPKRIPLSLSFWYLLLAACVLPQALHSAQGKSSAGPLYLLTWKWHQQTKLQAQKACCLIDPLCDSQDLGWSAQGGKLSEQCNVIGKTHLSWKEILISYIASPQGCLVIAVATSQKEGTFTTNLQIVY